MRGKVFRKEKPLAAQTSSGNNPNQSQLKPTLSFR